MLTSNKVWTEYDPEHANELLDGLGLTGAMARSGPMRDGTPLEFTVTLCERRSSSGPDEVGVVAVTGRPSVWRSDAGSGRALAAMRTRDHNGDIQVGIWFADRSSVVMADPGRYMGLLDDGPWAASYATMASMSCLRPARRWFPTIEPPEDHPIRRIFELWDQVQDEPDEATRDAMFAELLDIHKEHPVS